MINHFNPKSRRSHEQHYRKDACGSNRLNQNKVTYVVDQSREPHHSETITIERTDKVAVHNPLLESSIHKMEVEILVRIRS